MKTFYSNGKLLLTGEYVVLDGAKALAIPTKKGQSLKVDTSEKNGIHWKSLDEKGTVWFEATFSLDTSISEKEDKVLFQLIQILKEAQKLNPSFLAEENYKVTTILDFPRNWGLGTSSTLINNIAQWAEVDAFKLLQNSFGGSGYDIAAAQNSIPIIYQLKNGNPKVEPVKLNWDFTESLFFVHLNQKQDSKEGIAHYKKEKVSATVISEISFITEKLISCKTLKEFEALLNQHEELISLSIGLPTVKEQLFSDYPKAIKSLGAWGGDFVLAAGNQRDRSYFRKKGFTTIVLYRDMIQ
ncbi:GHMP kinase [Aureisphaera sp. CAU 1614]|uniref:GHMP kinase n=1 Tax=Halomarinibacterium sedimenti TaxID=2857106 RepID=A0A9X1FLZ7_9FLAO|nr:GYDIA family GHMP kinase [Halomarinibacterium sedimenti]MBW2936847.1 GHMP kinase [Halomarinibacterium sedimenti]